MNLRETFGRLNRAQNTLFFKVVASCVVTAVIAIAAGSYALAVAAQEPAVTMAAEQSGPREIPADLPPDRRQQLMVLEQQRLAAEATQRAVVDILNQRADPTAVAAGGSVVLAVSLVIIWMGLGLTYLGLLLVTGVFVVPAYLFGADVFLRRPGDGSRGFSLRDAALFVSAVVALTASFSALMQGLRLALAAPHPVTAIARNVVNEAVRMKVSIVFIILLIFGLATLPGLLHEGVPLRYRMQSFLQYGTSGTYTLIAILAVFLAVGTVAFEQRDRVIWQTMTKPVAVWQYLLGKWLGVVGIAGVLLAVSASGIFLFAEYLRMQPAQNEVAPFVARAGVISEDRYILERQVLSARMGVPPTIPTLTEEQRKQIADQRFEAERRSNPDLQRTDTLLSQYVAEAERVMRDTFLSLGPGMARDYIFEGLERSREANEPLTLRYMVNAGGNDPRTTYRITILVPQFPPIVRDVSLGQAMTEPIPAAAISPPGSNFRGVWNATARYEAGDEVTHNGLRWVAQMTTTRDAPGPENQSWYRPGILNVTLANGDVNNPETFYTQETIGFPPGSLEIFHRVGSYRANFFRVVLVLWFKIAFLAMVGITAATFLSFSVASLVSFGIFLMAEGAGFLNRALDTYDARNFDGDVVAYKVVVRTVSLPVAYVFRYYGELRPTSDLVDGRLLSWAAVAASGAVLGAVAGVLYAVAIGIFRRRELATYSGQ